MIFVKPRIVLPLVSVSVIALYMFTPSVQASADKSSPKSAPPVVIHVANAIRETVPVQINSLGTVLPYQSVSLKSRLDSEIIGVRFQDGDNVKAGDILFLLDDREIKAQLQEAKANLARDQAQLNNLRKKFERNKSLMTENMAISQEEYGDSKTALDVQASSVQADKATIESLEVQLSHTQIKAPIDGRTGTINMTAGNTVKANDTVPLVTINQISPILVQMFLPQKYFDGLRRAIGNGSVAVTATRDQTTGEIAGKMTYIDNTIDVTSGTFTARAVFPNEDEALWPGMLAQVSIDVGSTDGTITIPEVAVQDSPTGQFVYTVTGQTAKKVPVKVDRIQNGRAIIIEGLKEKDLVVTDGIMGLKDNAQITIATDKPATK